MKFRAVPGAAVAAVMVVGGLVVPATAYAVSGGDEQVVAAGDSGSLHVSRDGVRTAPSTDTTGGKEQDPFMSMGGGKDAPGDAESPVQFGNDQDDSGDEGDSTEESTAAPSSESEAESAAEEADGSPTEVTETEEITPEDAGSLPADWDEAESVQMDGFWFIDASGSVGGELTNYGDFFGDGGDNDPAPAAPADVEEDEGGKDNAPVVEDAPAKESTEKPSEPSKSPEATVAPDEGEKPAEGHPDADSGHSDEQSETAVAQEPDDSASDAEESPSSEVEEPEAPEIPDVDTADIDVEKQAGKLSTGAVKVLKAAEKSDQKLSDDDLVRLSALVMSSGDEGLEDLNDLAKDSDFYGSFLSENKEKIEKAKDEDMNDFVGNLHVTLAGVGMKDNLAKNVMVPFALIKQALDGDDK